MLVDYKELPDDAKVWIYPSNRKFYPNEIPLVEKQLQEFVKSWKSDDENFRASYQFLYNRFLIFIADTATSSLSVAEIDQLVAFILELQTAYKIELLDKMNVCFKQGVYVQYKELKDFKKLIKNRAVTGKTIVFDNLITNKKEYENYWELPIEESWYKRFL